MTADVAIPAPADTPEHRGERRAFLVWCLMVGAIRPERLVERIVAEVKDTPDE